MLPPVLNIHGYEIVNQNPGVITPSDEARSVSRFLPKFLQYWRDLEQATGFRWKCTSYVRDSPSHVKGHAIDFAPDIAADSEKFYAVYKDSDPVLYKRVELLRRLNTLRFTDYFPGLPLTMGVFVEPDHLHVQVLKGVEPDGIKTRLVKWGVSKPVYHDTYQRMALPQYF